MKAWENVPVSKKNNSESLVTCVHLFEKKKVGPFAILSIELIHDISKVKIVLKHKNIAKKSDFQLNSLAII